MATPSGQISLNDVQTEFGGSPPISINEYYGGGGLTPSGINVPTSGQISFNDLRGKSKSTPGNLVFTDNGSYVIPDWAGPTINIIAVGGGGGGGGGSGRTSWSGYFTGGGGAGAGAISVAYNVPLTATRGVSWQIGGGGQGGGARDGIFNGGGASTGGGTTTVWVGPTERCQATGGWGGSVAPATDLYTTGGYASIGSTYAQAGTGQAPPTGTTGGGAGAYGRLFGPNYADPIGSGFYRWNIVQGAYGNGPSCTQNSYQTPGPGTGFGAGGSGGGCNQSDVYRGSNMVINGAYGRAGIVFIWWGYTQ
jgi:hypothetical protein